MNKRIELYQSELGEKAVKIFLEKLHNLKLKKLPRIKGQQTVDYEILNVQGNRIAVCEVKSFVDTIEPIDSKEEFDYNKITEESIKRDKNHRSKLRKHLDGALSQLSNYQDIPKLIFFVSFDMTDSIDMAQVLKEDKQLYPSSQKADLYIITKIYQSIIPSSQFIIKETTIEKFGTEMGRKFAENYLPLSEALERGGTLPITFSLN